MHLVCVVQAGSESAAGDASSYLESVAREWRGTGLRIDTQVLAGDPPAEILHTARSRGVDLIVMATHAVGNQSILALTCVARRVLSNSPAPVLLVRPGGTQPTEMRTLLVPIDGSPGGSLALAAARALAQPAESRIVLLEVVVPVPTEAFAALPALTLGGYIDPEWEEIARSAAQSYVESLARRLAKTGVPCETRVTTGDVASEIIRCANELSADAVVMSSHAIAWPGQAYLGSVADQVVRNGNRPVLAVRREPPAGEPPVEPASRRAHVGR